MAPKKVFSKPVLPASEEEKAALQSFDVHMRQLVIDLDGFDDDRNRRLDFDEFSKIIRDREIGIQTGDSLRARFGKTKVNNAVHCTDLPEDGPLEVDYFFGILQQ